MAQPQPQTIPSQLSNDLPQTNLSGSRLGQLSAGAAGVPQAPRRARTREELLEQGVSPQVANSTAAQENMQQVLTAQFGCAILGFGCILCCTFPVGLGFLIWLIVAYFQEGADCEGPLRLWVQVAFCIWAFNALLNRTQPGGSLVQRMACGYAPDPEAPWEPAPMRVRIWDSASKILLPFAWNVFGIYCVATDSSTKHPCADSANGFYTAAKVYLVFLLVATLTICVSVLGVTTILRFAVQRGLVFSQQGADPVTAKHCLQMVQLKDVDLESHPECPICFEDFTEAKPPGKTKCGHYYHQPCLMNWLKVSRHCPLCRGDFKAMNETE